MIIVHTTEFHGDCVDLSFRCFTTATNLKCSINGFIRKRCKRTCGLCCSTTASTTNKVPMENTDTSAPSIDNEKVVEITTTNPTTKAGKKTCMLVLEDIVYCI